MNSVIHGKNVMDSISSKFHYIICQKEPRYKKYICDPVDKIANLQMLLKKYEIKNLNKLITTFLLANNNTSSLIILAC